MEFNAKSIQIQHLTVCMPAHKQEGWMREKASKWENSREGRKGKKFQLFLLTAA